MRKVVVWLVVALSILVVMGGLTWWLLTATAMTNNPLAIKLRHFVYFSRNADNLGRIVDRLPTSIIALQEMDTEEGSLYAYTLVGRFERVDVEKQIIYLTTNEGTYGLKFVPDLQGGLLYKDNVEGGGVVDRFHLYDPLNPGDLLSVQWTDRRILKDILSDAEIELDKLVNPYLTPDDFVRIVRK